MEKTSIAAMRRNDTAGENHKRIKSIGYDVHNNILYTRAYRRIMIYANRNRIAATTTATTGSIGNKII